MTIIQLWQSALTEAREATYVRIAALPEATAGRALVYIFLGSLVAGAVNMVSSFGTFVSMWGGNNLGSDMLGIGAAMLACGVPLLGVIGAIGFYIFTGLTNWAASLFGGVGNMNQLSYALAAIIVPGMLAGSVLSLLAMIPFLGFVFSLASLALGLYVIYLEVLAVKAVHGLSTGKALGALFLPGLGLGLLFACFMGLLMVVVGPAVGNMFEQAVQGMY